ncbi:YggS family pyridoxal phosphate-dependent enzyme [Paeniglutamicibacter cryotolerans]|uniref:Pyridoxal phosphate homeostasis protein n=1 Tax=Paeniglutamicibacter cryotolerans TaxID=670079 RepID=A0A839QLA7_9MICC|nr:YggS family pyridoxal phosphate-dependent enzyme [Paeniglutamicibacter cryotolerans]MBB2996637.1 hypothetical protein [Paeniglutamicibacter cryotolerans]
MSTTPETTQGPDRGADLLERLTRVRTRISAATLAAGRDAEPELIVVTKFFPASDVVLLSSMGVRQVGENRDQEASLKAAETRAQGIALDWNFIGQLQSNKAKSVVRYAATVQSVDRPALVAALDNAMDREIGRRTEQGLPERKPMNVLIQLDLREDPSVPEEGTGFGRGGADPATMLDLAASIASTRHLRLRGLMAVAPLGTDPVPAFAKLMELSGQLRVEYPEAGVVSAGMSQDLEAAVAAGATHLRIGSDVLGPRPGLL